MSSRSINFALKNECFKHHDFCENDEFLKNIFESVFLKKIDVFEAFEFNYMFVTELGDIMIFEKAFFSTTN